MLTTVDEATLHVRGVLAGASPRSAELSMRHRFIGVGQITWLGVMDREGVESTFFRSTIYLRRGVGIRGDRRCSSSPSKRRQDPLFNYLLPGVTSIATHEAWLVAEEDDRYRATEEYKERHGDRLAPGAQGENIRVCGLNLAEVGFGSRLYVMESDGVFSSLTLDVTGSKDNMLTLKVASSGNISDPLMMGWFIVAFLAEL